MTELGIVDIREIIRTISRLYAYDFSQYALTSFKYRIERFMIQHSQENINALIKRLNEDPEFFDLLLYGISVPSTEMFRDPSVWRWLHEEYLPKAVDKSPARLRVWLPNCVSGGELYSLAILLKESGLTESVEIIATTTSTRAIEMIKSGQYDLKKTEVSAENYKRFNGTFMFQDYFRVDRWCAFLDSSLLTGVELRKTNLMFEPPPQNVKLILFRNSLIYYNPALQERVLASMHQSLSASGHIITGIKELAGQGSAPLFDLINESENVYKKKQLPLK